METIQAFTELLQIDTRMFRSWGKASSGRASGENQPSSVRSSPAALHALDDRAGVDRENDGFSIRRQQCDQRTQLDGKASFFLHLADSGLFDDFAALDEARREAPFAGRSGARAPPAHQHLAVSLQDDRDCQFGIEIGHGTAKLANRTHASFDQPLTG